MKIRENLFHNIRKQRDEELNDFWKSGQYKNSNSNIFDPRDRFLGVFARQAAGNEQNACVDYQHYRKTKADIEHILEIRSNLYPDAVERIGKSVLTRKCALVAADAIESCVLDFILAVRFAGNAIQYFYRIASFVASRGIGYGSRIHYANKNSSST